jgi:hypothetical protein
MKDGGLDGLEAPRVPSTPKLPLEGVEAAVKTPPLAVASAAATAAAVAVAVATPQTAMAKSKTTQWNTKNLGLRLGADLVSAASAAVLVAPIISIIDRYVPL